MEKKDEAEVLLGYTYGSIYILAEGPLIIFLVAIPRNMGLFYVASTIVHGLTVLKRIQTTKNGGLLYCAFNVRCFIVYSMWTDQRAFTVH